MGCSCKNSNKVAKPQVIRPKSVNNNGQSGKRLIRRNMR